MQFTNTMTELPRDSVYAKLHTLVWGKPLDIFAKVPISRSAEADRMTIEVPEECLVCGGLKGPLSDILLSTYGIRGILVRAEYVEALRCVVGRASGYHGSQATMNDDSLPHDITNPFIKEVYSPQAYDGVAVIGPSGSGKSLFLVLVLILRLCARQTTIYQTEQRGVVLFDTSGAFQILPGANIDSVVANVPVSAWCLVDAPLQRNDPVANIQRFVLQVAPLQAKYLEWMLTLKSTQFFMKPWTLVEIAAGRIVQSKNAMTERQLEGYVAKYGPFTRQAYFYPAESEARQERRLKAITDIIPNMAGFEDTVKNAIQYNLPSAFEPVFLVGPGDARDELSISLTTKHVWKKLSSLRMLRAPAHSASLARKLYRIFLLDPATRAAASFILGDALLEMLRDTNGSVTLNTFIEDPSNANADTAPCTHYTIPPLDRSSRDAPIPKKVKLSLQSVAAQYYASLEQVTLPSSDEYGYIHVYLYSPIEPGELDICYILGRQDSLQFSVFQFVTTSHHIVNTTALERLIQIGGYKQLNFIAVILPGTKPEIIFPTNLKDKVTNICHWSFTA